MPLGEEVLHLVSRKAGINPACMSELFPVPLHAARTVTC
jgi:hypothetical protein